MISAIRACVVVFAAQAEVMAARTAAHVEGEDARAAIATELHRQRGEQDRLCLRQSGLVTSVAHVADVLTSRNGKSRHRCA